LNIIYQQTAESRILWIGAETCSRLLHKTHQQIDEFLSSPVFYSASDHLNDINPAE
jgi:hypothetical protein